MHRRTRSPMSLTFFKQQLNGVDGQFHRFRQSDAIWRWRPGRWLPNS